MYQSAAGQAIAKLLVSHHPIELDGQDLCTLNDPFMLLLLLQLYSPSLGLGRFLVS
jgi:hypothetical protein